jgi:hypothetical protein
LPFFKNELIDIVDFLKKAQYSSGLLDTVRIDITNYAKSKIYDYTGGFSIVKEQFLGLKILDSLNFDIVITDDNTIQSWMQYVKSLEPEYRSLLWIHIEYHTYRFEILYSKSIKEHGNFPKIKNYFDRFCESVVEVSHGNIGAVFGVVSAPMGALGWFVQKARIPERYYNCSMPNYALSGFAYFSSNVANLSQLFEEQSVTTTGCVYPTSDPNKPIGIYSSEFYTPGYEIHRIALAAGVWNSIIDLIGATPLLGEMGANTMRIMTDDKYAKEVLDGNSFSFDSLSRYQAFLTEVLGNEVRDFALKTGERGSTLNSYLAGYFLGIVVSYYLPSEITSPFSQAMPLIKRLLPAARLSNRYFRFVTYFCKRIDYFFEEVNITVETATGFQIAKTAMRHESIPMLSVSTLTASELEQLPILLFDETGNLLNPIKSDIPVGWMKTGPEFSSLTGGRSYKLTQIQKTNAAGNLIKRIIVLEDDLGILLKEAYPEALNNLALRNQLIANVGDARKLLDIGLKNKITIWSVNTQKSFFSDLAETKSFGISLEEVTEMILKAWKMLYDFPIVRKKTSTLSNLAGDFSNLPGLEEFLTNNPGKINSWIEFDDYFKKLGQDYWNKFNNPPNDLNLVRIRAVKAITTYPDDYVSTIESFGINKSDLFTRHGVDYGDEFYQMIDLFKSNNQYGLSDSEIYSIFGFTTNFFYKDLNDWLRSGINQNKTQQIVELISSGLNKLPSWPENIAYRGIKVKPPNIQDKMNAILARYPVGTNVPHGEFISLGSTPEASFLTDPNVKIRMEFDLKTNSAAKDISNLADGIYFRNYPISELILPPGMNFRVNFISPPDANGVVIIFLSEL